MTQYVKAIGVRDLGNFTHGKVYEVLDHIPQTGCDSAGYMWPVALYIITDDCGRETYVRTTRFEKDKLS